MDVNEQLVERGRLVAQMRAVNDKAVAEKRAKTADENTLYARLDAEQLAIKKGVDEELALQAAEKDNQHKPEGIRAVVDGGDAGKPKSPRSTAEYRSAFVAYVREGERALHDRKIVATLEKATTGGFLVPIEFETAIRKKMYDANIMRRLCSVMTTSSQVDIPMEGTLPTFAWIAEAGTYGATDLTIAQQILGSWKLGGVVTASEELLEDAFIDLPDYISDRSALAAGFAEEAAYLAGDGNSKPTGLLTTLVATPGNTTITSNSPTTVGTADVIAMFYGLSRPYRTNATFVFADSALKGVRSEKATTGQYIWQPALTAGAPDTLLGKPVYTSDFIAAVAATAVTGVFGDFKQYQIVDRVGWSMQKLVEAYALNGLVGFKMFERTDGKCLRPEAFVTLTQHA